MLQQDKPEDFVLATGVTTTIRDFCNMTFNELGIELEWKGSGVNEKGINKATGKTIIEVDPRYFRPSEVELLLGNPTKAKDILGWKPKHTFKSLVRDMLDSDIKLAYQESDKNTRQFQLLNQVVSANG